ncbi:hypothetical protein C3E98_042620, partial [Pseudomonas sp. MWU13-2625]
MKPILFYIVLFIGIGSFAQSYQPQKINPKAISLYEISLYLLLAADTRNSIHMLNDRIKIDSNYMEDYLSLAGAYGELKKYQQAVTHYAKARSLDSHCFTVFKIPYPLTLAGLVRFEE